MKKFLMVFICLLLAVTMRVNATPSQTLENLTAYEKSNAIIDIECEKEDLTQGDIIEETWNKGNYEEALELLRNLPELNDAAIGIQWKNPVKTSLRWAGDVRVGTVDSIMDIDFDVDNSNGNLLAALLYRDGPSNYRFTINISLDTGKTWSETYVWTTNPSFLPDIDCAVFENFFYLAYTYTNNTVGRIRRFFTSNGIPDDDYGYKTVIDETSSLREISLTSDADNTTPRYLFYFSIMENDSLRLYYNNDDTLAASWVSFNPPVGNADRGLDACCAVSPSNKMWASYIGTDDSLYVVGGWIGWSRYKLYYSGTNSSYVTSISAYGDTVITVFTHYHSMLDEYWVVYRITYNSGTDWAWGPISMDSTNQSFVNDVTARNGDGIGIVHVTVSGAEGFYTHRSYPVADFSTPVSFTDEVPRNNVKPCIERIADGVYGILYVNWPEQMAWFDRSDWGSGIDEDIRDKNTAFISSVTPIVSGSQIDINYYLPVGQNKRDMSLDIYDITGAHVKTVAKGMPAGSHSVTWFADSDYGTRVSSGIYFAVLKAGGTKRSLKITLIR
jgi:hypothetical protein